MSRSFKSKLRGMWKSRTIWGGAALSTLVAAQPMLMEALKYRLEPADFAVAGAVVFGVIAFFRWVTTDSLEDKGGK